MAVAEGNDARVSATEENYLSSNFLYCQHIALSYLPSSLSARARRLPLMYWMAVTAQSL